MVLFSQSQIDAINKVAEKSKSIAAPPASKSSPKGMNSELNQMAEAVKEYFADSPAILISSKEQLHDYIDKCIECGWAGIDTETTGLDRIKDHIVGASLYYPGGAECYIPSKHLIPIFDEPYKNQLSYEDIHSEFQRLVDGNVKLIFANADFDLAMIYKDIKVDLLDVCYYDVILAWRCLKEDEQDNTLKGLYNKYVLKGKGDPKKFTDFFTPDLFPYCKPEIAKLYAANDAKITYELFKWQLPYVTKDHPKCKKAHLEAIADLVWNIEIPMIRVCQNLHRRGIYLDRELATRLHDKYTKIQQEEKKKLADLVDNILETANYSIRLKCPFKSGSDFNYNSSIHVPYLLKDIMGLDIGKSVDKNVLNDLNLPVTKQIIKMRNADKLISTYIDKLPNATTSDSRVHAEFKSIGADTGRMCIAEGTEITVLNGKKRIEDIVPGDWVYCYSDSGTLQLSKVKNLWLTNESADCVDIKWQSSGKGDIGHLICTPDHPILCKDGTWVHAGELKRYDKLAHLRRTEPQSGDRRPALYGWNGLATREQDVVKYSIFNCYDSLHNAVHHIDEDPTNNELSNLELLPVTKHSAYHTTERAKDGLVRYEHLQSPEILQKRVRTQHEHYIQSVLANRDHLIDMIKEANGRVSKVKMDFTSFMNQCEIAGVDVEAECRKYNPQYHKKRISEEEFLNIYHQFNGSAVKITTHFNISYDKFYRYCKDYSISLNHMVQSVKPAGKHRVYDIEVENYHNFIASEICVHNSSRSPNLQNIPSHAEDIRHMFRASPGYVLMSSDYSLQRLAVV